MKNRNIPSRFRTTGRILRFLRHNNARPQASAADIDRARQELYRILTHDARFVKYCASRGVRADFSKPGPDVHAVRDINAMFVKVGRLEDELEDGTDFNGRDSVDRGERATGVQ